MLSRLLKDYKDGKYVVEDGFVGVGPETDLDALAGEYPWLGTDQACGKTGSAD
jgi:hypothetical protein